MEKLKRKRTINRKAGSHDLFYATMEPQFAWAVSGFFTQTWRTEITVAVAQCMNVNVTSFVSITSITTGSSEYPTGKVDSGEPVVPF